MRQKLLSKILCLLSCVCNSRKKVQTLVERRFVLSPFVHHSFPFNMLSVWKNHVESDLRQYLSKNQYSLQILYMPVTANV